MKGSSTTFDDRIVWYSPDTYPVQKVATVELFEDKITITTSDGYEKKFSYKDLLVMHKALTKIMGHPKRKKSSQKKIPSARIV